MASAFSSETKFEAFSTFLPSGVIKIKSPKPKWFTRNFRSSECKKSEFLSMKCAFTSFAFGSLLFSELKSKQGI